MQVSPAGAFFHCRRRVSSRLCEILIVKKGMRVLREGKGHAGTALITLGKLGTLGENGIMRQAVLVMNHPVKPGLRDSLAGAVNSSTRLVAGLPGIKVFDHHAVR